MLYDKETKIVSFEKIDVFPQYGNDTGARAIIYIESNEFYELESFHVENIRRASFSFGAYFPNESVFIYNREGNIIGNGTNAFDILMSHKYINVTASFKIVQVYDEIKDVSYPIISGHELKIFI